MPESGRDNDAKPSAAICSWKPKWSMRNALDAATSSTFSETADERIFMDPPGQT
jgi:hypothetical protein